MDGEAELTDVRAPVPGGLDDDRAPRPEVGALPTDLRVVLGRLARRLRREHRFPTTQASVLGYLERDGPLGISELAAMESVRPQSMSQTIAELEAQGLVKRRADPTDGRRTSIALTAFGHIALEADRLARDGWLAERIAEFDPEEQETLREAVRLLTRVADST